VKSVAVGATILDHREGKLLRQQGTLRYGGATMDRFRLALVGLTVAVAVSPSAAGATTFRASRAHHPKVIRVARSVDDRFTYRGAVDYTHTDSYLASTGCVGADGYPVDADAQTYFHGVIKWVSTFVVRGIPLQHVGKVKVIKGRVSVTGSTWQYRGSGLDNSSSDCPTPTTKWSCQGAVTAPAGSALAIVSDVKNKQDQTKAVNFEIAPFEGGQFNPPQCRADDGEQMSVLDGAAYVAPIGDSFPLLTLASFSRDMPARDLIHSGSIPITPTEDRIAQYCSVGPEPGQNADACTQAFEQSARLTAKVLKIHKH
jgi:hypothetical protein